MRQAVLNKFIQEGLEVLMSVLNQEFYESPEQVHLRLFLVDVIDDFVELVDGATSVLDDFPAMIVPLHIIIGLLRVHQMRSMGWLTPDSGV
jgi:hypothetical protein